MLVRRDLFTGAGSLVLTAACGGSLIKVSPCAAQDFAAPASAVENWMEAWRSVKGAEGALRLGKFADPIYFLTQPIGWTPNPGQERDFQPVNVPVGFVTDFASIPKIFISALRPDDLYAYAAVIHDYLYWTQDRPRDVADSIFKMIMQEFQVDSITLGVIFTAVRVGGGGPWEEVPRLKAAGEKRVLARFPEDPRIRWDDWRKRPGVFQ